MLSSVAILDSNLEGWTLLDAGPDSSRAFVFKVNFERPFATSPLVHVAIAGFDIENHDAARLRVRAVDIHAGGFGIQVETWLSTRVWSVDVSWLAIGGT